MCFVSPTEKLMLFRPPGYGILYLIMNISEDFLWRGLIKDKTFEDIKWLGKPKTFYLGVDASSGSMTIGNLVAMITARRLIEAGWKAIILAGGATSLIGDPGGKNEERKLKPREEIQDNVESIKRQISQLFSSDDYIPVDNYDWLKDLGYLDFLREVGKNFSMTELMQREFVTERMGESGGGISYAEFSYSLVQGYDYWHLYKTHKAVLQIGGSDQWGNMLSGVSLVRKKENASVHAFSIPLVINKVTGQKFGKSEGGAIWLDGAKTSPTQFHQFWINVFDHDAEQYLKIFTFLSKEKIEQVMKEHHQDPASRIAQNVLANEVTKIVHGQDESSAATVVAKYLTGEESLSDANEEDIAAIRKEIPSVNVAKETNIISVMVESGLAASKSDARRLLKANAVYINGKSVTQENFEDSDFISGKLLLRRGKAFRDSALVELDS